MLRLGSLAFAASILLTPLCAASSDCSSTPGYKLDIPSSVKIGTTFYLDVKAPKGSFVLLLISATPTPTPTPYGTLCVGMPLLGVFPFVMPSNCDHVSIPHDMPCNKSLVDAVAYFQFLALPPGAMKPGRSNREYLKVKDNWWCDCGGDDDDDDDECDNDDDDDDDDDCDHDDDDDCDEDDHDHDCDH